MAKIQADMTDVKEQGAYKYDVIPEGEYDLEIVSTEVKETKAKDGWYIILDLKVIEGEHTGKMLKDLINIQNKNKEAQKIGLGRLKKIAIIGGHKNPSYIDDSDEILGFKLSGKVYTQTSMHNGKTYEESSIKYYDFPKSSTGMKSNSNTNHDEVKRPWDE